MSFMIFFLVYFVAFFLQTYTIKKRFINKLNFSLKTRKYLGFALYLTFFGALLYPMARYFPLVPNWLYFLLSLPIGVIFLTFIITIFHDIISIGFKKAFKKSKISSQRRNFFKKTFDIGATSLILATNLKAIDNARHIELEVVDVEIKNLKKPYKIIQLSDIHIGGLIDKKFIEDLVKKVNILDGDLVVITGDLVDTKLEFAKPALDELKNIKSNVWWFLLTNR